MHCTLLDCIRLNSVLWGSAYPTGVDVRLIGLAVERLGASLPQLPLNDCRLTVGEEEDRKVALGFRSYNKGLEFRG